MRDLLVDIRHWRVNPDKIKPGHEVTFSRKNENISYLNLYFNNEPKVKTTYLKGTCDLT